MEARKKIKNQYRQGDILIERSSTIPADAKPAHPESGLVILARGEATNHHHSLASDAAEAWKRDDGQTVGVRVLKPSEVRHQEHAPIPVKRGNYRITRQREYSPGAIRNVAD